MRHQRPQHSQSPAGLPAQPEAAERLFHFSAGHVLVSDLPDPGAPSALLMGSPSGNLPHHTSSVQSPAVFLQLCRSALNPPAVLLPTTARPCPEKPLAPTLLGTHLLLLVGIPHVSHLGQLPPLGFFQWKSSP